MIRRPGTPLLQSGSLVFLQILYDYYFSNNGSGFVFMWKRAEGLGSVLCDDVLTIGLFSSSYEKMKVFSFRHYEVKKKKSPFLYSFQAGGGGLY